MAGKKYKNKRITNFQRLVLPLTIHKHTNEKSINFEFDFVSDRARKSLFRKSNRAKVARTAPLAQRPETNRRRTGYLVALIIAIAVLLTFTKLTVVRQGEKIRTFLVGPSFHKLSQGRFTKQ